MDSINTCNNSDNSNQDLLERKSVIININYYNNVGRGHIQKYCQYFTPEKIALFMAQWIVKNNPKSVLDPAVGNSILLNAVYNTGCNAKFTAYEVDPLILDYYGNPTDAIIRVEDYLKGDWNEKYEAIICNPPYNKFQLIPNRLEVIDIVEKEANIKLSGLTNQYLLFLIKSLNQLSINGKLAYIIPTEFMNSAYGTPVKKILLERQLISALIYFDHTENIFDSVLTSACILLLDNNNKRDKFEFIHITSFDIIDELNPSNERIWDKSSMISYSELTPSMKWNKLLKVDTPRKEYSNLVQFKTIANIKRGIATGANEYFMFDSKSLHKSQIDLKNFQLCVQNSRSIKGLFCNEKMLDEMINNNDYMYIFNPISPNSDSVKNYLNYGLSLGIDKRYLPSHRNPWYSMETRKPAPIWIASANRGQIKVVRNTAKILNLTTFHGIYVKEDSEDIINILFCYLLTPIAQELLYQNKKDLGNGLNKFQPNDLLDGNILDIDIISQEDRAQILKIYSILETGDYTSYWEYIVILEKIFMKYLLLN